MSRSVASKRVIRIALPGILAVALVLGIFLPGAVLAGGNDGATKATVEQMSGRPGYRAYPRAQARPSCGSNQYNYRYPQQYRQTYQQPYRQQYYAQQRYTQPRYVQPYYANNRYNDNYRYDNCDGFYYVVRRGDNLTSIARYYGISYQALARANGMRNANRIYAGQRIYIPSGYCR